MTVVWQNSLPFFCQKFITSCSSLCIHRYMILCRKMLRRLHKSHLTPKRLLCQAKKTIKCVARGYFDLCWRLQLSKVGKKRRIGRIRIRTGDLSHAKGTRYQLRHTPRKKMVPSRIELLILAFITISY